MTDEHPQHDPERVLDRQREARDHETVADVAERVVRNKQPTDERPRVDEEFVHERLDELEELLGDPLLPLATRLAARDSIRKIRAELDPTLATEGDG